MKPDCIFFWKYVYGKNIMARTKGQKFSDIKVQLSPQSDWTQSVWGSPIAIFYLETTDDRKIIYTDGLRIIYIDGVTIYDHSTRSDRMETRSDFSGFGAVTNRHGCKHKFPENKWSGPPC